MLTAALCNTEQLENKPGFPEVLGTFLAALTGSLSPVKARRLDAAVIGMTDYIVPEELWALLSRSFERVFKLTKALALQRV